MNRVGDWNCPQCASMNFASRRECRDCGCYRSKATGHSHSQAKIPKKGDWTCACGELNFASRETCYRRGCNRKKGEISNNSNNTMTPIPAVTIQPGDWTCRACQQHNFGSRVVCFQCGANRDEQAKEDPTLCAVCLTLPADTCITVCGHLYCQTCVRQCQQCPKCRQAFQAEDLLKVYH